MGNPIQSGGSELTTLYQKYLGGKSGLIAEATGPDHSVRGQGEISLLQLETIIGSDINARDFKTLTRGLFRESFDASTGDLGLNIASLATKNPSLRFSNSDFEEAFSKIGEPFSR